MMYVMKKVAVGKQNSGFMQSRKGIRPLRVSTLLNKQMPTPDSHKELWVEKPSETSEAPDAFAQALVGMEGEEFGGEPEKHIDPILSRIAKEDDSTKEAQAQPQLSSITVPIPLDRQDYDFNCATSSAASVLGLYGIDRHIPDIDKVLKPTPKGGVHPLDIVSYLELAGLRVAIRTGLTVDDLHYFAGRGVPIIVAFQAWGDKGASYDSYKNGHYAVVVGVDQSFVYFMDPSVRGNYAYLPRTEFERRWHDETAEGERVDQLGIIVEGDRKFRANRIVKVGQEFEPPFKVIPLQGDDAITFAQRYPDAKVRGSQVLAAKKDGATIGGVVFNTKVPNYAADIVAKHGKGSSPEGHISFFYVDPEHRDKGVGSRLLDEVLKNRGDVVLSTDNRRIGTNPAAIRLYEKAGFSPIKAEKASTFWLKKKASAIPDTLYSGSPVKVDELRNPGKGRGIFLTTQPGYAVPFVIKREDVVGNRKATNLRVGSEAWKASENEARKIPGTISVIHDNARLGSRSGTSSGFLYKVDASKIKDKLVQSKDEPREIIFHGSSLPIADRTPVTVNWKATVGRIKPRTGTKPITGTTKKASEREFLAKVRDEAKKRGYEIFAVAGKPDSPTGASIYHGTGRGEESAAWNARQAHMAWEKTRGIDPKHDWSKTAASHTCKYPGCKEPADRAVRWADGRAIAVCCKNHVKAMKAHLEKKNGALAEIVGVSRYDPTAPKGKQLSPLRKTAAEFAPGIPMSRAIKPIPVVKPKAPNPEWDVSLSLHPAAVRGDHYDLRLVDPKGRAHSWAISKIPEPGQNTYAAQQPTHSKSYALQTKPWSIPPGYGATRPGKLVEPVFVQKAEIVQSGPDKIRFLRHHGQETDEFVLRKMREERGKPLWALHNATKNRFTQEGQKLPSSKPAYKEIKPEQVDFSDVGEVMTGKIDGSHVLVDMKGPGAPMRVYSYRPTERKSGVIEHTFKFPNFQNRVTPPSLKNTMIRAELWASGKDGKAIPAEQLGGLLNAGVLKSRQKQQEMGVNLHLTGIDVVQHGGQKYENKTFEDKLEALRKITKSTKGMIELPPMARTPEDKQRLMEDIRAGRIPETKEGVVLHRVDTTAPPTKVKFKPQDDVYVRDIFKKPRGEARGFAGGFSYSLTPEGPVVGRVGTGFDHKTRVDMMKSPEKYIGRVAKVQSQGPYPSGALRAPSFNEWHIDKTPPELMKEGSENVAIDGIVAAIRQYKQEALDRLGVLG